MSTGQCAAFYEAAGYVVVRTASASWYNASSRIYRSLPDSRCIEPTQEELRTLLVSRRLLGVEFATRQGRGYRCHYYCARSGYDERVLHRTFQQSVRRARAACTVRELSFDDLHRLGAPVNHDVRARRRWVDPHLIDPTLWRRYCDAGKATPGVVVFGCFAAGELASWIAGVVEDRTCYGLQMMSRADLRSLRPNNLLYYQFTTAMLARDDVNCVNTGLEPTPPAGNMDRFKRYAGYSKEPCQLAAAIHPAVGAILLGRAGGPLLALGRRFSPPESRLGRVEALATKARASQVDDAK
jgi:hypothetical protein